MVSWPSMLMVAITLKRSSSPASVKRSSSLFGSSLMAPRKRLYRERTVSDRKYPCRASASRGSTKRTVTDLPPRSRSVSEYCRRSSRRSAVMAGFHQFPRRGYKRTVAGVPLKRRRRPGCCLRPPKRLFGFVDDVAPGKADVVEGAIGPFRQFAALADAVTPDVESFAELAPNTRTMMIYYLMI